MSPFLDKSIPSATHADTLRPPSLPSWCNDRGVHLHLPQPNSWNLKYLGGFFLEIPGKYPGNTREIPGWLSFGRRSPNWRRCRRSRMMRAGDWLCLLAGSLPCSSPSKPSSSPSTPALPWRALLAGSARANSHSGGQRQQAKARSGLKSLEYKDKEKSKSFVKK